MSLLTRYLVRQNIFLVLTILFAGTGLYLLTDLFERLDNFLDADVPLAAVLLYFGMKVPLIISQILPAVFLLAMVIQLNILERNRELTALYAGGISPVVLIRFIFLYGLLWAAGQFFFSQVLGVEGDRHAASLWQEEVRKQNVERVVLKSRWFTDNNRIIHFGRAVPVEKSGSDVLVYTIDASGIGIQQILKAKSFTIEQDRWVLNDVLVLTPATYSKEDADSYSLPIRQDLTVFQMFEKTGIKANQLPPWELDDTIRQLEQAGSNVEILRTALYSKFAYAASILIMGLLALTISQWTPNIYKGIGLSLLFVFLYYSLNTFSTTLGEKGFVAPIIAAGLADITFFLFCLLRLVVPLMRR